MIKQHPPTHSWQETSTQQPVMMNTTEDMVNTILTDLPIFLCRSNYDPILKFKFTAPLKTISFGHPIKFNT